MTVIAGKGTVIDGAIGLCYGCNNPVVLGLTARGAMLPLETEPSETGHLAVSVPAPGRAPLVRYLRGDGAQLAAGEQRMTAHWDLHPACKGERKKRNHGKEVQAMQGQGDHRSDQPKREGRRDNLRPLRRHRQEVSDEATQAQLEAQARAAIARLRAPG